MWSIDRHVHVRVGYPRSITKTESDTDYFTGDGSATCSPSMEQKQCGPTPELTAERCECVWEGSDREEPPPLEEVVGIAEYLASEVSGLVGQGRVRQTYINTENCI